jgi:hypothetical protein
MAVRECILEVHTRGCWVRSQRDKKDPLNSHTPMMMLSVRNWRDGKSDCSAHAVRMR